jgi:hypothetical protein
MLNLHRRHQHGPHQPLLLLPLLSPSQHLLLLLLLLLPQPLPLPLPRPLLLLLLRLWQTRLLVQLGVRRDQSRSE